MKEEESSKTIKKRSRRVYITDRDFEVLRFLWKWKAASTAAIAKKFFPGIRPFTAYERLLQLEKKKYVQHISFRHRGGGAWTLDGQGYRFLFPHLLEMKAQGYRSENVYHDYYATAFHLGEWLTHQPSRGRIAAEQELRRLEPDLLPSWVPNPERHRPDGYSICNSGATPHLFAFECELSQKAKARYELTISFYDAEDSIKAVFWLAGSPAIQRVIEECIRQSNAFRPDLHHFLQFSEFKRQGWKTPLVGGSLKGLSLSAVLLDKAGTEARREPDGSDSTALLQNQKRPILIGAKLDGRAAPASDWDHPGPQP